MTLNLTEEQAMLIRQALCNSSTRALTRAFEAEDELKALGREDRYLVDMEMELHNEYKNLIDMIDEARA